MGTTSKLAPEEVAIDGFLHRKTRYGAWKERYFRTEGHNLYYYTDNLNLIKANKLQGAIKGPYRYKKVGSASETVDLRGETSVERIATDDTCFVVKHGAKTLEIRAPDEELSAKWQAVLGNVIHAARATRKQVGTLRVEVDGAFMVGGRACEADADLCALSFQLRDEVTTSDPAPVLLDEDLVYENLDESVDPVGRCALSLDVEV